MTLSTLHLSLTHRPGQRIEHGVLSDRWTFDFLVDGRSLADWVGAAEHGLLGRLDRDDLAANARNALVIMGMAAPDLEENRVMLFVCSECADLGCGAITTALNIDGQVVTWSDFRYENSYDDSMTKAIPNVGLFTFDLDTYRAILQKAGRAG